MSQPSDTVSVNFPAAVIKLSEKKKCDLREKGIAWAHIPRIQSVLVGKWWQQELEAAGYIVSTVGRRRAKNAGT